MDSADSKGSFNVTFFDGVTTPVREFSAPSRVDVASQAPLLIFGHGLSDDAADYEPLLNDVLEIVAGRCGPADSDRVPRVLVYDARGHGASEGWQNGGTAQFHWRSLAVDMLQVATAKDREPGAGVVLGGCSMGAATALWAALLSPRTVRGLVLYMVPTMWETRKARRGALEKRAQDPATNLGKARSPDVLMGAAFADLPVKEELAVISLPTLIVNCRDDPVHPASSAEELAIVMPNAKVVIVDRREQIERALVDALAEWFLGTV